MKKYFLFLFGIFVSSNASFAQEASYDIPATLSYYGTIVREEGVPFPAANYVTTNPINDGALIWVPVGSKVMFRNTSADGATAYKWTVQGAEAEDATSANLIAVYNNAGTYEFPTLTATYSTGESTYAAGYKIKVGGRAELCHSDTREWGKTYGLGSAAYDNDGGFVGGSNNRNVAGVGNFYRFSSPDMYVDGVNIYAAKQPKSFADGAKVKLRIYLPYIGDDSFSMIGSFGALGALEAADIPMGDYRTRDNGAYLPSREYAVYTCNIANPMNCEGYPYLFFAVEGFDGTPNKAVTEDFVLATDVIPGRALSIDDYSNALAHNSFARQIGETDYLRPISIYGGASMADPLAGTWRSYNFWICPLVRGAETPASGIEDIVADRSEKLVIERSGDNLIVSGAADGTVRVYGLNGVCHAAGTAANGGIIFNIADLQSGVYVVSTEYGVSAKFLK